MFGPSLTLYVYVCVCICSSAIYLKLNVPCVVQYQKKLNSNLSEVKQSKATFPSEMAAHTLGLSACPGDCERLLIPLNVSQTSRLHHFKGYLSSATAWAKRIITRMAVDMNNYTRKLKPD